MGGQCAGPGRRDDPVAAGDDLGDRHVRCCGVGQYLLQRRRADELIGEGRGQRAVDAVQQVRLTGAEPRAVHPAEIRGQPDDVSDGVDASGGGEGQQPALGMADQIRRAGAGLGWRMEPQGAGLMRGTLDLRTHQAVVAIPYDTQRFSIRYVSSSNLDYDGRAIHRNYNSWVRNLQNAIMAQPAVGA